MSLIRAKESQLLGLERVVDGYLGQRVLSLIRARESQLLGLERVVE